jgi:poly-gamma-glutamate synthesis protein (capsule biosynthesis protein)
MKEIFFLLIFVAIVSLVTLSIVEAPNGHVFTSTPAENKIITLAFVGDVMLGRNVEVLMNKYGHNYPFASSTDIFKKADFIIANLEGPIPEIHSQTNTGEMSFSFPAYVPEILYENGIDAVSLANNHTFDKGTSVFTDTVDSLNKEFVGNFGHPLLHNIFYVRHYVVEGISFSLIGFNSTYPSFNLEEAVNVVNEAKVMYPNDRIILFMHWGDEYQLVSNTAQKNIADKLHDAGVDLIIGSHPHVTQEISCDGITNCTLYSLGNFIFDQYFSKDVEQGLVAYITLDKSAIQSIEIVPIQGGHSQPRIMSNNTSFINALITRSDLRNVEVSTSSQSIILR